MRKCGPSIVRDSLAIFLDFASSKSMTFRTNDTQVPNATTVYDLSGNGNDFVIYSAATAKFLEEKHGVFDFGNTGTTSIEIKPTSSTLTSLQNIDSHSLEFWLNFNSTQNGTLGVNAIYTGSGTNQNLFMYRTASSNNFEYYSGASTGEQRIFTGTTLASVGINTGEYFHLVVTATNGDYARLYVNGEFITTTNSTATSWSMAGTSQTNLGQEYDSTSKDSTQQYLGKLGLFRIYSKPLSLAEVKQNYETIKWRYLI